MLKNKGDGSVFNPPPISSGITCPYIRFNWSAPHSIACFGIPALDRLGKGVHDDIL